MLGVQIIGSGELADDMKEILKTVVDKFYKDMSQGFIMVLAGYAQAAYSQRANDLGGKWLFLSNQAHWKGKDHL